MRVRVPTPVVVGLMSVVGLWSAAGFAQEAPDALAPPPSLSPSTSPSSDESDDDSTDTPDGDAKEKAPPAPAPSTPAPPATPPPATAPTTTTPPASPPATTTAAPPVAPTPVPPAPGAPDAFDDGFDTNDDMLSFTPESEDAAPPPKPSPYGETERRRPPPPVPTAEADPIPVAVYGVVGLVMGLAVPVAVGSLGGLALASALVDPDPDFDSCGVLILGFFGIGAGLVASGPLGVLGATAGTAFGQISKGSSLLPSLGGAAAGLGLLTIATAIFLGGVPAASTVDVGIDSGTLIIIALTLPAVLFVLSGPVAVGVTVLIEQMVGADATLAPPYTSTALPPSVSPPRQAALRY